MDKTLLLIAQQEIEKKTLLTHLKKIGIEGLRLEQVDSIEEGEQFLIENKTNLLVIDSEIQKAYDFVSSIKNDENFRSLPVVMMLSEDEEEGIKRSFLSGADAYVTRAMDAEVLSWHIRPLLINNTLNEEMVTKTSQLQDQAVQYYILLELIRKYIPKTVWDTAQQFSHEQRITIPETELELTVVFADIKEFTRITHNLPPREVIHILNSAFEIVTQVVYENGGDVDKFIGDAFFAVFDDAEAAVRSMVLVQKKLEELNRKGSGPIKDPILFRIGIHSGPVIRGNVGGNLRYDNTLIGDTVNAASRLEGIAEPGSIVISDETRVKAGLEIPEELGFKVRLRGRDKDTSVYNAYPYLEKKYSTGKSKS